MYISSSRKCTSKREISGFTLIEVVLVLAIGGLIFLLAFLAFQQVQINRRETQRRSDFTLIEAALLDYYKNTGSFPSNSLATTTPCTDTPTAGTFNAFIKDYICKNNELKSPSGDYTLRTGTTALQNTDQIRYAHARTCSSENKITTSDVPTDIAMEMKTERGFMCRKLQ